MINECLDFIKFALEEISKLDDIDNINISEFYGYAFCLDFKVKFNKLGSYTFRVQYSISNGDRYMPMYTKYSKENMREQLKDLIKEFKDSEITECEEKINFYLNKLEEINKRRKYE